MNNILVVPITKGYSEVHVFSLAYDGNVAFSDIEDMSSHIVLSRGACVLSEFLMG